MSYYSQNSPSKTILACKIRTTISNLECGLIQVVAEIEGTNLHKVSEVDYPHMGEIFVTKGFESIDRKYTQNQFFKVTSVWESNNFEPNNPYSKESKFLTISDYAEPLSQKELVEVVDFYAVPTHDNTYIQNNETTPIILLDFNDYIYGPFQVQHVSDQDGKFQLSTLPKSLKLTILNEHHILKIKKSEFSKYYFETYINNKNRTFIYNIEDIIKKYSIDTEDITQIDFISDQDLLKWGKDSVVNKKMKPTNAEYQKLKNGVESIKTEKLELIQHRKERLLQLLESIENINDLDGEWHVKLHDTIIKNKQLVDEYIKNNANLIESKLKEKTEELKIEKIEPILAEIKAKEKELEYLKTEISDAEKNHELLKENAKIEIELKNNTLKEEAEKLSQEIIEKKQHLKELENTISKFESIKEMEDHAQYLERHKKILEENIDRIKNVDLVKEVGKVKTYLDLLSGAAQYQTKSKPISFAPYNFSTPNGKIYISSIKDSLASQNRDCSLDEVANFLICLRHQFLTLLVGRPGSGKTSLVYLMAKSLGLVEDRDFLPISVARGWTSQRDILGFYNSLSMSFQESSTRLYSFLNEASNFTIDKSPLKLILLDEANLSPIEHYWADFLKMCDPESEKTITFLDAKGTNSLLVGDNVRFIGTINHDSTTERLSPRLLDRAAIITIEPNIEFSQYENFSSEAFSTATLLKYTDFLTVTGDNLDFSFTSEEKDLMAPVFDALTQKLPKNGHQIILSPRKMKTLALYCSSARLIFDNPEDPKIYIDYALSQFVLPGIEGYGESFLERLDALMKEVHLFPKARTLLQRIIENGKSAHHSYSFFD